MTTGGRSTGACATSKGKGPPRHEAGPTSRSPESPGTQTSTLQDEVLRRCNAIVAVTLDVLDDSVRELRFVLRFDVITDTSFRVLDAVWLQRCQTGRGHQGWSRVLCV